MRAGDCVVRLSMSRRLFFGVDAGGTKTTILLGELIDGRLHTVGEATGPAGNPRSIGFEAAFEAIERTLRQAYESAGISFCTAESSCFSVAGAGRPEERRRILDWCTAKGLATKSVAVGDAECLLACVASESIGIALIAGTGSMAWGRNARGETARAGGYGYLFDDEGSGYWIAARALNHVCKVGDARSASSSLAAAVLEHLKFSSVQELVGWCYGSADPRSLIASLAPIVFAEYAHDRVAKEIIQCGARSLASLIVAVTTKLSFPPPGYVLATTGSVLIHQPVYRDLVCAELDRLRSVPREVHWITKPAAGALNIAWEKRSELIR